MKILHTADLHLGHQLYGYDRREEQEAMLNRIAAIAEEEKPDALLLSGDIFHTANPSASISTLFADRINALRRKLPDMAIVVTAGNHDSGVRHEIFRRPWQSLGVTMIGTYHSENPEEHIIHLPGRGYIVAVPYIHTRNMPEDLFRTLSTEVEKRNTEGLPVVLCAHTTVEGCDTRGHDMINIGGIDALKVSDFGEGFDYIALGHIHKPQNITACIRYSGTPLPVSFDETYPHSVSMVEIAAHGSEPDITELAVPNPHPLITFPCAEGGAHDECLKAITQLPEDLNAYVRVNLKTEGYLPSLAASDYEKACRERNCRFCLINPVREKGNEVKGKPLTVHEFKQMQPEDVFSRYLEEKGIEFTDDMHELFNHVIESLDRE